jgi:endonuclease/exonuclease/phosphatase family metal-dependent hydrolase
MLKGLLAEFLFVVIILAFSGKSGYPQVTSPQSVRIMFYNVENFFDIYDDSLTDDNEFLPKGLMRWNIERYKRKTNSVYKTIIAAGQWDPPAIIAFCEIENRKVLEDLIYGTYLSKYNFGIIHEESPDRRGIDVCLIYRKKIVEVLSYKYWIPKEISRKNFNTRSVLYAKLLVGYDTLHLFANHWPSRRGGVLAGENFRMQIAKMVREKADSILDRNHSDAKIIILGDFNAAPDEQEIKMLTISGDSSRAMINLSEIPYAMGLGTYRYMGTWEMIDQVIVSNLLLRCRSGFYTDAEMLKIFRPDFLLKKDSKYPGSVPFSNYRGYKYQGGFSDHLPVLLDLKLR